MSFVNEFRKASTVTKSENGGNVFTTTGDGALLDLFATIGGMRHQPIYEVTSKWRKAYKENPTLAANLILYTRDIRNGGIGERAIGRALLRELATVEPEKIERNLDTIVNCGRWDDLFCLLTINTLRDSIISFVANQLAQDMTSYKNGKPISLLAKWAPSINASSCETRRLANILCKQLHLSPKTYRQTLASLRKYSNVVERKMSDGDWSSINFETVPSLAMSRYNKAYRKHTPIEFQTYLDCLKKGTVKINAATLNPTDICKKFLNEHRLGETDIAQWDSLPDYIKGENEVLCVSDVSGSMSWPNNEPMAASIGLATYFAQRNKGSYHGLYMTFTDNPHFIQIDDDWSIEKCFRYIENTGIGYSTNMDKALAAVYDLAIKCNEAPKVICIISDGEMDRWVQDKRSDSIISKWNNKLIAAGLNPVKIVSWNVAARNGTVIAPASDYISYCSGYGAGVFKQLITLINNDAYEAMCIILNKPEFSWK